MGILADYHTDRNQVEPSHPTASNIAATILSGTCSLRKDLLNIELHTFAMQKDRCRNLR